MINFGFTREASCPPLQTPMITISLFTCSKTKWRVWRDGFFPANQSFFKSFYIKS